MMHAIPTTIHATAEQLADLFHAHVFKLHGLPLQIVSDRDPRFTADFWSSLFKALGTKLSFTASNNPQADGQTENANKTLEQMLRAYVSPFQTDWDKHLAAAEFAYNSSVHASTGYTPFFLNYGFTPDTPATLLSPALQSSRPPSGHAFATVMEQHITAAREALKEAQSVQARNYNKHRIQHTFKVGDMVYISHSHFSNHPSLADSAKRKLAPRNYGPFEVTEIITPVSYRLKLPPRMRIHDVIPISRLRPCHIAPSSLRPSSTLQTPVPDIIDGEEHYKIQYFVQEGTLNGYPAIMVHYEGQDDSYREWLYVDDLKEDLDSRTFNRLLTQLRSHKSHSTPQTRKTRHSRSE
jgi:hypothetical protein